jgi:hypothetical protein
LSAHSLYALYSFGACRLALLASSFGWVERTIPFLLQILNLIKKMALRHLFFVRAFFSWNELFRKNTAF